MSVEFRQRTPGEYLKIIRRRKWLIILPVIAITSAVAWVVYRLPDLYESSTLIVVTPSTLPNSVVPTMNDDSLTRQLTSIAQVVTSRSSLEPLVTKYELYAVERARGEAMESVIAMMRRDINVEVNRSRNDITNGFNITYRGRDPKTTQAVTAELASKYISETTRNTVTSTTSAVNFIDSQVLQAKTALDEVDKQRLDFLQGNVGSLPSESGSLLSQLSGLRDQQKTLIAEIGRLQDRRAAAANQLALMKQNTVILKEDAAESLTDPKSTQAWAQLAARKAQLEGELTRLRQELKDKHPDVVAKQKEIEQVKGDMEEMVSDWKIKIKEKQEKLDKRPDLTANSVEQEIKLAESEIKRQQTSLSDNEKQISELLSRLNLVPGAEVQLAAIDRDYQTKKAAYDSLLAKQAGISLGANALNQQQGEGIAVVDAANLPSQPVAPKRLVLFGVGFGLGLVVGLILTAVFEVPRLLTIQTAEDARHYTSLPVLISVPELLTPQEAKAIPRRRRLLLAAGVAVTVVSIPVLALALKLTHVFEILSSGRTS
jgi:succinoglycan biosynthesis transport protein ExoP